MRELTCSVCGKVFQYNKRGRTPKRPVCDVCAAKSTKVISSSNMTLGEANPMTSSHNHYDNGNRDSTPRAMSKISQGDKPKRGQNRSQKPNKAGRKKSEGISLDFCFRPAVWKTDAENKVLYFEFVESDEPFKENELLYWIPERVNEGTKHTDGRLVEFVKPLDGDKALVRVCRKVGRKKVTEELTTKLSKLTRFKVKKVPVEEVYSGILLADILHKEEEKKGGENHAG